MKLTLSAEQLADALAFVSPAVPKKTSVPIMFGVLITATDQGLTVYASDYDNALRIELPAATDDEAGVLVQTPGQALVPHSVLAALVGKLKAHVEIVLDGTVFRIRAGRSDYQLATLPVEQYPDPVDFPTADDAAVVKAEHLRTALHQVQHAASRDDTLPQLTGVNIEPDGKLLRLSTTDRYRMAQITIPVDGTLPRTVLPAARELIAVAKHFNTDLDQQERDDLVVSVDGGSLILYDGRRGARLRLIESEFPKLTGIIEKSEPRWLARLDRHEVMATVDRIAVVADDNKNAPVTFTIWPDHAEITAQSAAHENNALDGIGTCKAGPLDGQPTPDWPVRFGFQPHYLLDALKALTGDVVALGNPGPPTMPFRIAGAGSLQLVLMPIRLPDQR